MMEDTEFEKKIDIDDLVLPSKPMNSAKIDFNDIKQEPFEAEEGQQAAFESYPDREKKFKLKMEVNILKLYEELDKDKYDHPTTNFRCSTCVL